MNGTREWGTRLPHSPFPHSLPTTLSLPLASARASVTGTDSTWVAVIRNPQRGVVPVGSVLWFLLFLIGALVLAYQRVSLLAATVAYGAALFVYALFGDGSLPWMIVLWLILALLVLLNIDAVRIRFITRPFLRTYRRMLPSMSQTEKDALEAGTVWWDGELFTGDPNWEKLLSAAAPKLSAEEQAFLDG